MPDGPPPALFVAGKRRRNHHYGIISKVGDGRLRLVVSVNDIALAGHVLSPT